MATRSPIPRRIVQALAASALVGATLVGPGAPAGASSTISRVSAEPCTGGTVDRGVTVTYSTDASFTTAVRVHVVAGAPNGPTIDTVTVELVGPTTITIPFSLPPGTYYFDWEDRAGDGVTWSGRHSGLGSFYSDVYAATRTDVVACEAVATPSTTTTTPATTTTAAASTTGVSTTLPTTSTSPDVTPFAPPPSSAQASTTAPATTMPPSTVVTTVPSTPPRPPATAQSTVSIPPDGLVATGANPVPMVIAGVAFLGLGAIALLVSRRAPGRAG